MAALRIIPGQRVVLMGLSTTKYNGRVVLVDELLEDDRVIVRVNSKLISVPLKRCRPLPFLIQKPLTMAARCTQRARPTLHGCVSERMVGMLLPRWAPDCEPTGQQQAKKIQGASRLALPSGVVDIVTAFLLIAPVSSEDVIAVAASSFFEGDQCSLANSLTSSTQSWWISKPAGRVRSESFTEWVTYQLGTAPVCVGCVGMRIPPLPHGPLSVRVFHLEAADNRQGPWERVSRDLTTLDQDGLQQWVLPTPLEVCFLRIVCTRNAAGDERKSPGACIGYYQVKFSYVP